jgi:hypothetical protein
MDSHKSRETGYSRENEDKNVEETRNSVLQELSKYPTNFYEPNLKVASGSTLDSPDPKDDPRYMNLDRLSQLVAKSADREDIANSLEINEKLRGLLKDLLSRGYENQAGQIATLFNIPDTIFSTEEMREAMERGMESLIGAGWIKQALDMKNFYNKKIDEKYSSQFEFGGQSKELVERTLPSRILSEAEHNRSQELGSLFENFYISEGVAASPEVAKTIYDIGYETGVEIGQSEAGHDLLGKDLVGFISFTYGDNLKLYNSGRQTLLGLLDELDKGYSEEAVQKLENTQIDCSVDDRFFGEQLRLMENGLKIGREQYNTPQYYCELLNGGTKRDLDKLYKALYLRLANYEKKDDRFEAVISDFDGPPSGLKEKIKSIADKLAEDGGILLKRFTEYAKKIVFCRDSVPTEQLLWTETDEGLRTNIPVERLFPLFEQSLRTAIQYSQIGQYLNIERIINDGGSPEELKKCEPEVRISNRMVTDGDGKEHTEIWVDFSGTGDVSEDEPLSYGDFSKVMEAYSGQAHPWNYRVDKVEEPLSKNDVDKWHYRIVLGVNQNAECRREPIGVEVEFAGKSGTEIYKHAKTDGTLFGLKDSLQNHSEWVNESEVALRAYEEYLDEEKEKLAALVALLKTDFSQETLGKLRKEVEELIPPDEHSSTGLPFWRNIRTGLTLTDYRLPDFMRGHFFDGKLTEAVGVIETLVRGRTKHEKIDEGIGAGEKNMLDVHTWARMNIMDEKLSSPLRNRLDDAYRAVMEQDISNDDFDKYFSFPKIVFDDSITADGGLFGSIDGLKPSRYDVLSDFRNSRIFLESFRTAIRNSWLEKFLAADKADKISDLIERDSSIAISASVGSGKYKIMIDFYAADDGKDKPPITPVFGVKSAAWKTEVRKIQEPNDKTNESRSRYRISLITEDVVRVKK